VLLVLNSPEFRYQEDIYWTNLEERINTTPLPKSIAREIFVDIQGKLKYTKECNLTPLIKNCSETLRTKK